MHETRTDHVTPGGARPVGTGDARAGRVFAALGDATRRMLLDALCAQGPASIAQLTAATTISRQAVTKHLRVLADAGLASDAREGRERRWRIEPRALGDARQALDRIARQWDRARIRRQRHAGAADADGRG